ncbi:MAG: hypothetical protein IJV80_02055 [Clostridia bacterium]|nr:hypothetical protein [Clostridia bacterium]
METIVLILLYYLSQNPDFPDKIKPFLTQLNDSKKMLDFLGDLSKFQNLFSSLKTENKTEEPAPDGAHEPVQNPPPPPEKEKSQSPTKGIANEFIEGKLEEYFSRVKR